MPIYEYRCADCGKTSTFLTLSVTSAFEPKCRHCGSGRVRKLVSRVAVIRSGSSEGDLGDDSGGWDGESPDAGGGMDEMGGGDDEGGEDLE